MVGTPIIIRGTDPLRRPGEETVAVSSPGPTKHLQTYKNEEERYMKGNTRWFLLTLVMVLLGAGFGVTRYTQAQAAEVATENAPTAQRAYSVTLYKNPSCTCCGKWGDHLREHGFEVHEEITDNVFAILDEYGVPNHLRSCHVGVVDGYALVGHVPADLAQRLLEERPKATGIAVPGMPLGSPGMESPLRKQSYKVIAFGPDGEEHVYASR